MFLSVTYTISEGCEGRFSFLISQMGKCNLAKLHACQAATLPVKARPRPNSLLSHCYFTLLLYNFLVKLKFSSQTTFLKLAVEMSLVIFYLLDQYVWILPKHLSRSCHPWTSKHCMSKSDLLWSLPTSLHASHSSLCRGWKAKLRVKQNSLITKKRRDNFQKSLFSVVKLETNLKVGLENRLLFHRAEHKLSLPVTSITPDNRYSCRGSFNRYSIKFSGF